ncbi:hypothetical protein [Hymenobacter arizonensis]|uniref:Uncharacterized protein n=1 Tax=Hymenobacter arizonensis TaxID=1227077 RepID=A0A1I6AZW8_HYMAR|nr:hypothetical protein [Hymenobacter arizonensis]SFQ74274.1 hypothetical protein SAMN04515668_4110 [Hymenobacter arizonensis]
MPHISPRLHTALRNAVAARFGQPLLYPSHCDALEAELQKAGGTGTRRLSPSTLRRFFGLVDKEGGYHLHTLDTLARYAGHSNFADFGRAVSSLAESEPTTAGALTDIPELLAMERLSCPERLLLGNFLGRVSRPSEPRGTASPLALRLAAHPAGQVFFVESFVDLAHLNGAYGEVLREYLKHKLTAEAKLFGYSTLFLGEFLAEDEAAWRARLPVLLALPVPAEVHAFPRGRRAFAELVAAWHDAPQQPLPPATLARLRREAAAAPPSLAPAPALPAFYNHFPAGYHFFVAEALFLTEQFGPLLEWLEFTQLQFPELATLEQNVYNELLRAFRAVAELRTGHARSGNMGMHLLFQLESHSWLLDYYQVHIWLVELHLADKTDITEIARLQNKVLEFSALHRMPFFNRVAQQIAAGS